MSESGLRRRLSRFWSRHRTLFWSLHSVWALTAGIIVLVVSRERYDFVPWAIGFLVATWLSTLFFGRRISIERGSDRKRAFTPGLASELTSYLTRAMYQQTLFFLLPFYWSSTVMGSPNGGFIVVLAGLALFSCLELVFDRWLRTRPVFGLVFFATVTFAAINLLLPLFLPIGPAVATPSAALVAVASAVPLSVRASRGGRGHRTRLLIACALLLGLGVGTPQLVPPVPLRLKHAVFTTAVDRETLVPADTLSLSVPSGAIGERLAVLAEVFAPSIVPTRVSFEWVLNGKVIRRSRVIQITAHRLGFRVWDGYKPPTGRMSSGRLEVTLRTEQNRIFGRLWLVVI